ncbi:MAG: hypothetical protein ACMUEL_06400 [Flavobacteriales bacterium Tduv]
MGSRTHYWYYKALVWIKKGSLQGLAWLHAQHLIEAMAHNLYRNPVIIISF